MNGFDEALERLLTDPAFARALAADPTAALAGYRLTEEEHALLRSQVTGDRGGQTAVETRANQSGVFGMLAPLADLAGEISAADAPGSAGFGAADARGAAGFGVAEAPGSAGFGAADARGAAGFGVAEAPGSAGFGAADVPGTAGFGAAQPGSDALGVPERQPPPGYHIRVDADGDGTWDRHMLRARPDGGVDILVDADRDGRIDFIGHDADADGLVESADYDKDGDGFFEKTMYDDTGDGWLDRTVRHRPPGGGVGDALGPAR
ncbi:Os1348 family NHLP clan protein [Rhizomonospora bruguierae]|uniref:Os1348 family NHLP clan protein n=1 Tax=Rhizomonospora bruguierae TaxID=1581705 RepID=UPI001BD0D7F4|nr:Os1348 family NHLP clan protein [Micromonospora sp. NBRC 107566]